MIAEVIILEKFGDYDVTLLQFFSLPLTRPFTDSHRHSFRYLSLLSFLSLGPLLISF